MAASKLNSLFGSSVLIHCSFSKVCDDYLDGFSRGNLRNVENSVLVCLVLDVYFPAVFMVENCQGMTTFDHIRTNCTIICKGKRKLKFIFLNLNNR